MKPLCAVFVGSFRPAADGALGGQLRACQLLVASELSQYVRWRLLDTTMRSLPPPSLCIRAYDALIRAAKFVVLLLFRRVDAVLVFSSFAPFSLAEKGLYCWLGRLLGKRIVLSVRSEVHDPARFPAWSVALSRRLFRNCHVVACQTEVAAQRLQDHYECSPGQTRVIPNWIDVREVPDRAAEPRTTTEGEPVKILFVGWVERFKGIYELVGAAERLREAGHAFKMVICGEGSEFPALIDHCRRRGLSDCFEFRGWVGGEEKQQAFQEADIFVLPSHSEGMPNAVMEAMTWGLPVVASAVGGVPALVASERNGFLVPPRDESQLADALERLIINPALRVAMGRANRQQILERHDINHLWRSVGEALGVRSAA